MKDKTVERLARYAASLKYDDFPPEVVHQAKRLVVDSLGCGIGAFNSTPAKAVRELASRPRVTQTKALQRCYAQICAPPPTLQLLQTVSWFAIWILTTTTPERVTLTLLTTSQW